MVTPTPKKLGPNNYPTVNTGSVIRVRVPNLRGLPNPLVGHMSYSLNSVKGGYMLEYIGDDYRGDERGHLEFKL